MKKKQANQQFAFIPLSSIEPSDYQRPTNPQQVENIINNFDEAKLGTLTVSYRDGCYFAVDGAHRLSALRSLKYTHALCEILVGLTYEQEADYFMRQGQDKRALKPYDLYKAGLIAGDLKCIVIENLLKDNSFKIGFDTKDFYQIGAIGALFAIVEDYGFEVLDETLHLIDVTWEGIPKASSGVVLLGVAEFVNRYGARDFCKRLSDCFSDIWFDYKEAMKRTHYSAKARQIFCRVLVEHYNRGLSDTSKKRLKWEE